MKGSNTDWRIADRFNEKFEGRATDQNSWLVRNYFDSWTVSSDQCQCVTVTEDGVAVSGGDASMMGLPVRP